MDLIFQYTPDFVMTQTAENGIEDKVQYSEVGCFYSTVLRICSVIW